MAKSYKFGKYTVRRGILISKLKVNEMTTPRLSGRYRGTSIGRDRQGYFVTTHRARSKSHPTAASITLREITWIRSTG